MAAQKRIAHGRVAPAVSRRKLVYMGVVGALAATATLVIPTAVEARITKVTITTTESPTFGGFAWPGVGQYEKILGTAYGELDPNDPHNAVIVDIKLAPRNATGKVEYSHNFYLLKPIDLSKGNHKVVYDAVNRGSKTFSVLNRGLSGDDPGSVTDARTLSNSSYFRKGTATRRADGTLPRERTRRTSI